MDVVLISTYELGHQPFGLASPAAWLKAVGARVACLDLAVQAFEPEAIARAGLVAIYVPMHTATRLAATVISQVREANPTAHICCYGLYAPLNEPFLRRLGAATILGGEFESGLVALYQRLSAAQVASHKSQEGIDNATCDLRPATCDQIEPRISLARQAFLTPDRGGLPGL